jgi:serine/threonine protein kinase
LHTLGASFEFQGTDRFAVLRRLGAGGMGIVYEVLDRERNSRVALKTLRNVEPQALYRLKNEFRSLQDLQHPNLVTLGELIEERGNWFFTMELVAGVDFLAHVRPRRDYDPDGETVATPRPGASAISPTDATQPLPLVEPMPPPHHIAYDEARLRNALPQLALGIDALHCAGKVHRDIKPSNIQVTPDDRVVLLDFGLITDAMRGHESSAQHVVGTAAYMAPEQGAGKLVGPAADWYSLGVVLYQALSGRLPFTGPPLQVLMNKQQHAPTPVRELAPDVPEDLERLCDDLLHFDPRCRPTGGQILRRLDVGEGSPLLRSPLSSASQAPPFVGRQEQQTALVAAFDDARRGAAVTVFVEGESGVGKSALIRHFTESLGKQHSDAVILSGRCYERESVPYKALDGVVDALSRHLRRLPKTAVASLLPLHASLLPNVFPVLGRVEAIAQAPRPRAEVRDPRELRNRVFSALRELFSRLALRQPLVVVIDDLQWADADSLLLLGDILRTPESPPLLLVASVRSAAAPAQEQVDVSAAVPGDVRRISLTGLPREQAHELAATLLTRAAGESQAAVAAAIAEESHGHPLFIDELVRHTALATDDDRAGLRLDDAIWARIARLDFRAAHLLEFIAVAGVPLPQETLCEAAEVDDAGRELALLRAGHLVRSSVSRGADVIEPYHDRIREAVLAHIHPDNRKRRHGRLAVALEGTREAISHPEILVHHLEAAGRIDEATARAEQAAARVGQALAFDRAAQLYRTALRLGTFDDAARRTLYMQLGESLANSGRGSEAAAAYLTAAEGADAAARLDCQRRAAEQLLICGHIDQGLDVMRAVLRDVGVRLPTTPRGALLSLLANRVKLRLRGVRWKERDQSDLTARDLARLDVYKSVAHGLGVVDTVRGADFQTRGLLLALRTGERTRIARTLAEAAGYHAVQGGRGMSRGRDLLRAATAIAEDTGDPYLLALTMAADGLTTYYEGHFRLANDRLRKAETAFLEHTTGTTWELNTLRLIRLLAVRRTGAYADLTGAVNEYVHNAERRGDRHLETSLRRLFCDTWLARDDVASAQAELDRASWVPPEGRYHVQHWYELRARAEIDLYAGAAASAHERLDAGSRSLERSLLLRIQDVRTDYAYVLGRCALRMARTDGDVAPWLRRVRTAIDHLARERIGYATAWAHLLGAGLAATRGDATAALAALRAAEGVAEEHDMALCVAAARRRRGALLGGTAGAELIADADSRMAALGVRAPARMTELVAPGL